MAATMALQRRRLLALLAAGSAGLAGCRATEDDGSDPTTTPTGTSTSSPTGTPGGASAVGCPPYERSSPDRVVCSADPPEGALVFEPDRSTVDLPRGTVACRLENTAEESFSTNFYGTTLHKHQDGEWHFLGPYVVPQPLHTLPPGGTHVRRFHVDNTDLERVDFPEPETPSDVDDAWVTARHGLGPGTYALGIDSAGEGPETVYSAAVTLRGPDPGLVAPETVTGTERDGDHVTVDVEARHEDAERHDLTVMRVEDPSGEVRPLVDEHLYHPRFAGLRAALASIGDAASVTVRGDDSGISRNLASGMGPRLVRHRGGTYRLRLGGPPETTSRSFDLSGGWREFAADRANTGQAGTTGPDGEPSEAWRFESPGRLYDSPTVAGDLVLQPSTDGNLYALTAADGEEVWRFAVRGQCRTTPAVRDGTVYVAGRDGGLYALDATSGEAQWRFDGSPEGYAISHPTVADGTVYIGDDAGTLFAVDAASGEKRWSYAAGDDIASSPAVVDGTVYVGWRSIGRAGEGADDGGLDAVSTDGTREWRVRPGNVDGSPTVVDGTVYAGSEAGLLALDAATGEERWTLDTDPMSGSPAVVDGTVYVGTHEGTLYALEAETGQERWAFGTGKWCDYAPAVAGAVVYHTSWDAHVYAVDRDSGEERWRVPFGTPLSAPVVADGTVYAASNRSLVALR